MNNTDASHVNRYRRKERFWLITVLLLVVVFGFVGGWFFEFQSDLSLLNNILLFGLINLNVILLLLLAYLVLRNIVKLVFERKRNILGHKLRTRLVIAFMGLCLIPTLPLFWIATQFISFSLEYWFSHQVEQSLEKSVELGKDYLNEEKRDLALDSRSVKDELLKFFALTGSIPKNSGQFYLALLEQYNLDGMFLIDVTGALIWRVDTDQLSSREMERLPGWSSEITTSLPKVENLSLTDQREALVAIVPLSISDGSLEMISASLIAVRLLPTIITEKLAAIATGYEDYLQLKLLQSPLKTSNFITFSIVTLLVIFAAIWFGFFLAKNMTVPIQALVSATQQVAEGNLDIQLKSERQDELGMLINSFNKMVQDLSESRAELDSAYLALQQHHAELEDRKLYMEIVLKNIAAGVVSVDAFGNIVTMNKSAEITFGLPGEQVKGHPYASLLQPEHTEIVKSFMHLYHQTRQDYLEQQIRVAMTDGPRTLLIKASVLRDEQNNYMGVVVVLDDLTDIEKAQRMAAWREVARRIAHEIKNPLTPIQLSAQRLRRKYSNLLEDEESIFEECTRTIVQQVEHMKHLVNEFSKFARLPRVQAAPSDLPTIVEESLAIYRHTYPHISLLLEINGNFPTLLLDPVQFKQVMVNLLDNAIHALDGGPGKIEVKLFYDPVLKIAKLECSDTGHGISAQDKVRMFEPYYSTKEKGTGLGLTIVASIVADHSGFIRVRDNTPKGTVISVELPG